MKVSELNSAFLDLWVARATGQNEPKLVQHWDKVKRATGQQMVWIKGTSECDQSHYYEPSHNWEIAGPIIEQEGIGSHKGLSSIKGQTWEAWTNRDGNPNRDICYTGATLLEAAMRCYVASKFGNEVPDEIDN